MEAEVASLLQQLQDAAGSARASNAEQLELFQQAQERALHRDPSGTEFAALRAALPFLLPLTQLQNAALAAGILQLLARAAEAAAAAGATLGAQLSLSTALLEAVQTVLLLSYSTDKTVLLALQLALSRARPAFKSAVAAASDSAAAGDARALVDALHRALESAGDLVASGPSGDAQAALVWLRAWKLLETSALLLSSAQDAAVFRDPARSNVQPDALTLDKLATAEAQRALERPKLEALSVALVERMSERALGATAGGGARALGRRELCVAVNSLALLAALRPQFMPVVLPTLCNLSPAAAAAGAPTDDAVVQKTLQANLVKLLSHPSAQAFVDEITDVLIAAGASERAFRAISKSKEPRRKYVSDVSLQRARVGKRSAAQTITERVETAAAKRTRVGAPATAGSAARPPAAGAAGREQVTHDGIVNMPTVDVVNLVLESFASEMPQPPPPELKLELAPSELKARMAALLGRLATPSSALALEKSLKRSRDPRRRRDPRVQALQHDQPALVQVFDDAAADETSDWISKNAASIAEPLVSVLEDNSVQVFLKPADPEWCREMAMDALARILANEYGVRIRGDGALREHVLCRLAADPWLLEGDGTGRGPATEPPTGQRPLPGVLKTLLDFVLEDSGGRASLGSSLLRSEYYRAAAAEVQQGEEGGARAGYFREAVAYLFGALAERLDVSSAADRRVFGGYVSQLPRVTVELLHVVKRLLDGKAGVVLGITVLRDLVKERQVCQAAGMLLLLRYTCHEDEPTRNSAIRCVANQLYAVRALRHEIEAFAERLVDSLREAPAETVAGDGGDVEMEPPGEETVAAGAAGAATAATAAAGEGAAEEPTDTTTTTTTAADATTTTAADATTTTTTTDATTTTTTTTDATTTTTTADATTTDERALWLKRQVKRAVERQLEAERELLALAGECQRETALGRAAESEAEVLRRLELLLALCAKKPALLARLVAAYAHASEAARQVIFQAIEKLIKHLKQRGGGGVVAQLHGFEASALGLVCHVIQILAARSGGGGRPSASEAAAEAALVAQVVALYRAHTHVPDAVSVLIPVLPRLRGEVLFPLLPALLALPPARVSVAVTKLLEALPPQPVAPIDLLVALHHVDLRSEPSLQKKAIHAINCCVEHRHAFPADVLLHVCRVLLVHDARVSRLALRTLILSVTTYPSLQADAAALLDALAARRVWDMGDAVWRGFVKCAALVQPASLALLAQRLPPAPLRALLSDEPALAPLLAAFVSDNAARLRVAPDVYAVVRERADAAKADVKAEDEASGAADGGGGVKTDVAVVETNGETNGETKAGTEVEAATVDAPMKAEGETETAVDAQAEAETKVEIKVEAETKVEVKVEAETKDGKEQ